MMSRVFPLARLAYGVLFLGAGLPKMADAAQFAHTVFNYQILPGHLVNAVALLLPAVEVVCGLALCLNVMARSAVIMLNALMVVFLAALGLTVWRGIDIACGCFGAGGSPIDFLTVVRDVAFLGLGLFAMWGVFRRPTASGPLPIDS
ncbi:DoxX family membrane protein [Fundidesulfovibrio butyratiphilus]